MEKQRVARQAALVKQLECGCPDSTCADGKSCSHPMRRITAAKGDVSPLPSSSSNSRPPSSADNNNQVSSTTGSGSMLLPNGHTPRVYSRDSRNQQCSSSSANTPPLVLSLSQIQGGGGLLILNSNSSASGNNTNHHQSLVSPVSVAGFVCNTRKSEGLKNGHVVLKQEAMDTNQSSSNGSPVHTNKVHHRHSKMDIGETLRQSMFENVTYSNQERMSGHNNHQTEVVMSSAPSTPSKRMDTTNHDDDFKHQNFCTDTVVVLEGNAHGTLVNKSNGNSSMVNNGFFNETLDLSQEDIQRTLSANMPLCSSEMDRRQRHHTSNSSAESVTREMTSKQVVHEQTHEINPMDFINSCDVVVSPTHVVDDDVFVNLDAFDMLGEFPDLEVLDSGHAGLLDVNPSEGVRGDKEHVGQHHQQQQTNAQSEGSAKITDYSPEWAYPEGGVKVLVTGPWHSSGPYTVLFDTFPVPTTLVQSGVLRCYCPGR